jgi:hypothetical protein
MTLTRRISAISAAAALALGAAAPATAWAGDCYPPPPPPKKKQKCNAGNGNGSDAVSFVAGAHCFGGDPGNSFNAGNKGGDEIHTTVPQGGSPNPGGNNDPGP